MADSIIMERVADAAAECFYAELVKTEDLGAFEALVAAAKGAGGARGKIAELAAYAANHASEIRPPAHELGTIEGTNAHIGAARPKGQAGRGRAGARRRYASSGARWQRDGRSSRRPHPRGSQKSRRMRPRRLWRSGADACPRHREGAGAAASGSAAGEVRDDIPISKELGSCYR